MFSETLLLSGWTLTADELPQQEPTPSATSGFSLPGADALAAFADLLGVEEAPEDDAPEEAPGMPLTLPGMLPKGTRGRAALSREIAFGRLTGDRATLEIDHLCGKGRILLGETTLGMFRGGEGVRLDLTDALRLGRRQTLTISFDDAAEAGVCGAVMLRTTVFAQIESVSLSPDALRQTLHVAVSIRAQKDGLYALRAALAGTQEQSDAPWRETRTQLWPGVQVIRFDLAMRAPRFEAGRPYTPPVLKLTLLYMERKTCTILADSQTAMVGYSGKAPRVFVPLTKDECALAPDALLEYAKALHVDALYAPMSPPPLLQRRATLEGVALLTVAQDEAFSPCMTSLNVPPVCGAVSPAAACWQLCGMPSMPRVPDALTSDRELLLDAVGRQIDADNPETAARMRQLRALQVRLCAEAARQEQYAGALCAPGDWRMPEIADALATALAPLHLSVLPLRGAWWTHSFFSATVQAFIPDDQRSGAYTAEVLLLGEQGETLASFRRDCDLKGGVLGIVESRLPEHPCALTLCARLYRSGAIVEAQAIPVYVGERGPLEAAFE